MSKVITFSRYFPAHHSRKGQPTYFVEGILTQLGIMYKTGRYYKWLIENNPDISEIFLMKFFDSLERDIYPKSHTIRNYKRPVIVGNLLNPKCWAGKPNNKTPEGFWQIKFAPDIEVKKVWDIKVTTEDDDGENDWSFVDFLDNRYTAYGYGDYDSEIMVEIAKNDGLNISDFYKWFLTRRTKQQKLDNESKVFSGQIICWNENIIYEH